LDLVVVEELAVLDLVVVEELAVLDLVVVVVVVLLGQELLELLIPLLIYRQMNL
jgi:hypothetical protein